MDSNEIRISVVIPVYNVAKYLPVCMESLLRQKFSGMEFILVDDGSTDESGKICDDFGRRDPRVAVLHKENGGLSSARNAGLARAKGRYVGFVDGDDWVSEEMFGTLYRLAEAKQAQIVSCRYREVGAWDTAEAAGTSEAAVLGPEDTLKKFFLRQITESVCDKLFFRELFQDVRFPEGEINEDTAVFVKLVMKSRKNVFLDRTLYFYRKREGSITKSGYSRQFLAVDRHIREIEALTAEKYPGLKRCREYFFGVHYYCLLLSVLKDGRRKEYRQDYIWYLRQFGRYFRSFMKWGTGKPKDRILAVLLILRCGPLLYGGFR